MNKTSGWKNDIQDSMTHRQNKISLMHNYGFINLNKSKKIMIIRNYINQNKIELPLITIPNNVLTAKRIQF